MDNNVKHTCRTCLDVIEIVNTFDDKVFNLFEPWYDPWEGMGSNIAEDLEKLTRIHIDLQDDFSKEICSKCAHKLRETCTFLKFIIDNEKAMKLNYFLSNSDVHDAYGVKVKEEVMSDKEEEPGATNWLEGYTINESDIKPEIGEEQESENINNFPYSNDINGIKTYSDCEVNGSQSPDSLLSIKEEPSDEDDYVDVPTHCLLCSKKFNSISGLKAHVITRHSYKTINKDVNTQNKNTYCKTCNKTFSTPTDLMVHESYHVKNKCFKCNQEFNTFAILSKHSSKCLKKKTRPKLVTLEDVRRPQSAGPANDETPEETEELKCSICQETFTEIYYLEIHKETHSIQNYEVSGI